MLTLMMMPLDICSTALALMAYCLRQQGSVKQQHTLCCSALFSLAPSVIEFHGVMLGISTLHLVFLLGVYMQPNFKIWIVSYNLHL